MQGKRQTHLLKLRRLVVEPRAMRPADAQPVGGFDQVASLAGASAPAHAHPAGEVGFARLGHHCRCHLAHPFHIDLCLVHLCALPLRRASCFWWAHAVLHAAGFGPWIDPAVLCMACAML